MGLEGMAKSGRLRAQDVRLVHQILGECGEMGDDAMGWRTHWIARVAAATDGVLGYTGEMGGCRRLRPIDMGVALWGYQSGFVDRRLIEETLEEFRTCSEFLPSLNRYLSHRLERDGVCLSRRQIVEDPTWYRSDEHVVIQNPFRVDHALYCFQSIDGGENDICSGILLYRERKRRDFGERDRAIIREAHAGIVTRLGGPLAKFAEPSPRDLTLRVRQVLGCLLDGDSDKQISARLGMSPHTVNQHVKRIFQHFGVKSRTELLSRWIRRRGSPS